MLAVIVLAGGLSISLFTITFIYTMAYKPLELPNGQRIVEVCGERPSGACLPLKAFEFATIRSEVQSLEKLGVYSMRYRSYVQTEDKFIETAIAQTEPSMFQFSESGPILGRIFQETDSIPQAEPVAVLSYDFWKLAFEKDPAILGLHINLNGTPTRVIGVMPQGFTFPRWSDIWIPAGQELTNPANNEPVFVSVFGYRKQGVSNKEANQEINNLLFRMRQQYPFDALSTKAMTMGSFERDASAVDSGYVTSLPRKDFRTITDQMIFIILITLSGILFLLACINVGTLLLARTNERMKDISICVALGAPRKRLLVQTMSESIVITILGASLAVLLSAVWLEALNFFNSTVLGDESLEFWMHWKIENLTLLLAVVFALLTVMITSALPSWRIVNGDFNAVMRDGTRGARGIKSSRFSKSLVVTAVALISILLYTFTVFGSVMWSLGGTYRVVQPDGIYSVEISTNNQFANAAERLRFAQSLQSQILDHPDSEAVLMAGVAGNQALALNDDVYFSEQEKPRSPVQVVAGDLGIIGVSLLEGRLLDTRDNSDSAPVAIVSVSLAERLWPGQSPVGENMEISFPGEDDISSLFTIVGMVSDSPIDGSDLFKQEFEMVYLPLGQIDSTNITAIMQSRANEQQAVKLLGDIVLALNSGVDFSILSWVENRQMTSSVINSVVAVFAALGIFAFLVSIAGIFGLTKNSILLRTQEIGTRRALGASDSTISRNFTLQGAKQTLTGMMIAFLICAPFAYLIASLAGNSYIVPGTIVSMFALLLLFLCTLAAIYQPIRKLLKQEPSDLLRHV